MNNPSSIPGHKRGPVFTPTMRLMFAGLVIVPLGSYVLLKSRIARIQDDKRRFEEEGRRSWIQAQEERMAGKD